MSLMTIVCVSDGIALSADSRTLGHSNTGSAQDPLRDASVLTDKTFKLHLLWGAVAVAASGDGHVARLPVSTHLAQLEASCVRPPTAKDAAQTVLRYLSGVSPDVNVTLWIAAYEGMTSFIYEGLVKSGEVAIRRIAVADDGSGVPVFYYDARGGRPDVEQAMLVSLKKICPPELERMSLNDAAEFSRHLVRTVINQTRFAAGIAPVGGPIDTLVLTPHGPVWLVRKIE